MKINFALIVSTIAAVGLVAFVFTAFQIYLDRQQLNSELENKTIQLAEDFFAEYLSDLQEADSVSVKSIDDSVVGMYNLNGVAIYFNKDSIALLNPSAGLLVDESIDFISQVVVSDSSMGKLININGEKHFQYIKVISRDHLPDRAVVFYSS